jgi:PelA/Pel-15E family pectate lyase
MKLRAPEKRNGLLFATVLALATFTANAQEAGPPGATMRWSETMLRQKATWYSSPEARAAADTVLLYQSREGGWPKNHDLLKPPVSPAALAEIQKREGNTIDNGATTMPLQFLALVIRATGEARYRESFARGLDYLFASQYASGGWPQFYPLREGYYSRITYNDGAMIRVMTLLREVAAGRTPYDFVEKERRARAAAAVQRGIDCILKTQIKHEGRLTVWCAQHDKMTLAPAWARKYEPPSLSGSESVGVVRFLMEIEQPAPEIVAAIEGAITWLQGVAIHELRVERFVAADGMRDSRVIADPAAGPLWARFYELGTHRPLFMDRDSKPVYSLAEIDQERRGGYAYYGTWGASLLATDYPQWRARHKLPPAVTNQKPASPLPQP